MLTRRQLVHTGLVTGCTACVALAANRINAASSAGPIFRVEIDGPGYALSFVGSQRQTILTGDRAAHFDLRTLAGRPHLYGIGPIEGLTGEVTIADSRPSLARLGSDRLIHVTERFDAGVPFFVWAEVPAWQTVRLPDEVRSCKELERFVGDAGAKAGLTQAFPFVIRGRPELIDFHIVNAAPDTAPGIEAQKKIQIPIELHSQEATFVGFWSSQHQGIFTQVGTNMHVHFQTLDNDVSGHVQSLKLSQDMILGLPVT